MPRLVLGCIRRLLHVRGRVEQREQRMAHLSRRRIHGGMSVLSTACLLPRQRKR